MRSLSSLGAGAAKGIATAALVPALALLTACATQTTATLTPSPQAPLCDPAASALVLWAPPLATAAAGAAEPTWSAPIVDRRAVTVRGNATATVAAALTPP